MMSQADACCSTEADARKKMTRIGPGCAHMASASRDNTVKFLSSQRNSRRLQHNAHAIVCKTKVKEREREREGALGKRRARKKIKEDLRVMMQKKRMEVLSKGLIRTPQCFTPGSVRQSHEDRSNAQHSTEKNTNRKADETYGNQSC